jgi:hypothetical protein
MRAPDAGAEPGLQGSVPPALTSQTREFTDLPAGLAPPSSPTGKASGTTFQLAQGEWTIHTFDEAARLRALAAETRNLAARISLRPDRELLLQDAKRLEDAARRLECVLVESG